MTSTLPPLTSTETPTNQQYTPSSTTNQQSTPTSLKATESISTQILTSSTQYVDQTTKPAATKLVTIGKHQTTANNDILTTSTKISTTNSPIDITTSTQPSPSYVEMCEDDFVLVTGTSPLDIYSPGFRQSKPYPVNKHCTMHIHSNSKVCVLLLFIQMI